MGPHVVLCTYNGARFLRAQLDSIARQTRPVDCVHAFDDGSDDDTLAILHDAAARLPMKIVRNPTRLGATGNYAAALAAVRDAVAGASTGGGNDPLILLCDHDDIWHPCKVQALADALAAQPAALLAASDACVLDAGRGAGDTPLAARLGVPAGGYPTSALWLAALLRRNRLVGATFALRAALLDQAFPVPLGFWHDEWLALLAVAQDALCWVPEPLIDYHLHDANAAGLRQIGLAATWTGAQGDGRAHHAAKAARLVALRERIDALGPRVPSAQRGCVDAAARFWQRRAALPSARLARGPAVVDMLRSHQYTTFAGGLRSALRDLIGPGLS